MINVNVTQDVLRHIAKLSNFNVDVQARNTGIYGLVEFRAICTKCGETLMADQSIMSGKGQPFEEFCKTHRHDAVTEMPEPSGRKFKTC